MLSETDVTNKVEHSGELNITKQTEFLSEVDLTEILLQNHLCYQSSLGGRQAKSDGNVTCLSNLPKLPTLRKLCKGVTPDGACGRARNTNSGFSTGGMALNLGTAQTFIFLLRAHDQIISICNHFISLQSIPKALQILHLSHFDLTFWYAKGLHSIPFPLPFQDVNFWKYGNLSIFRVVWLDWT